VPIATSPKEKAFAAGAPVPESALPIAMESWPAAVAEKPYAALKAPLALLLDPPAIASVPVALAKGPLELSTKYAFDTGGGAAALPDAVLNPVAVEKLSFAPLPDSALKPGPEVSHVAAAVLSNAFALAQSSFAAVG
jgi:hypothetical protein